MNIGDLVEIGLAKPRSCVAVEGVIIKVRDLPWGFTLQVQVVNGNILYERGELVDCKPAQVIKIDKILPQ